MDTSPEEIKRLRSRVAKSDIEDLDEEIERLTEYRQELKDWLAGDRSNDLPPARWEKYPNG